MDINQTLQAVWLVVTFALLLYGGIKLIIRLKRNADMDQSFKLIVTYWLVSGLTADLMTILNLFLSTVAGGWPLGFAACEFWGFVTTTMTAYFAWMICVAVLERYYAIMMPADVASTFSKRNTSIISTGVFLLVFMAYTGPFYGFGEYSYLRGYLSLLVSTNITLSFSMIHKDQHEKLKLENLHQLFSHLKHSSYASHKTDLLTVLTNHLQEHYDLIVSKATWLKHGLSFDIRAMSIEALDQLLAHYNDKAIAKNLTELSFIEDVAKNLNISDTQLTVDVSTQELNNYRHNFLPLQELGICTSDLTTSNYNTSIWVGFSTMLVFVLPYCLSLAGLCVLYLRGFGYNSIAAKHAADLDVSDTNMTSTVCTLTCLVNLIYYTVILSNAAGELVDSDVVFWATYIVSIKSLILVLVFIFGNNSCAFYCACFHTCVRHIFSWRTSDNLSYELADIETTQVLTGKHKTKQIRA